MEKHRSGVTQWRDMTLICMAMLTLRVLEECVHVLLKWNEFIEWFCQATLNRGAQRDEEEQTDCISTNWSRAHMSHGTLQFITHNTHAASSTRHSPLRIIRSSSAAPCYSSSWLSSLMHWPASCLGRAVCVRVCQLCVLGSVCCLTQFPFASRGHFDVTFEAIELLLICAHVYFSFSHWDEYTLYLWLVWHGSGKSATLWYRTLQPSEHFQFQNQLWFWDIYITNM